jgi:hypothetical protein
MHANKASRALMRPVVVFAPFSLSKHVTLPADGALPLERRWLWRENANLTLAASLSPGEFTHWNAWMQTDAQWLITKASFRGQSHRKPGDQIGRDAEVLDTFKPGIDSHCIQPWFSLPGQTGLAAWSGLRLHPVIQA